MYFGTYFKISYYNKRLIRIISGNIEMRKSYCAIQMTSLCNQILILSTVPNSTQHIRQRFHNSSEPCRRLRFSLFSLSMKSHGTTGLSLLVVLCIKKNNGNSKWRKYWHILCKCGLHIYKIAWRDWIIAPCGFMHKEKQSK